MLELDLSFTITAIIALTSLISPWISNLINNRHQRKMKLLEYEQDRYNTTLHYKREIFEKYVISLEKHSAVQSVDTFLEYSKYYSLVYMYSNNTTFKNKISSVHEKMSLHSVNVSNKEIEDIINSAYSIIGALK